MRKYAIEIYILSLVVLATAILVISDWDRVSTLFAGKNDPDHKVAALAYFCGEGQLAGPGCAYADASSFIDRDSGIAAAEPSALAVFEALPEPKSEPVPDVTLALSDVGEPVPDVMLALSDVGEPVEPVERVEARDSGAIAMISGQWPADEPEMVPEMADVESAALTVIAALERSIPVATETDPLAGQPKAAAAQPVTAAPARLAASRQTPSMSPAPTAGSGPVEQTAALASLDKGAAVSEPGSVGYVVIGSFGAAKNANRFAGANKHLNARTIVRVRKGRLMHLVVAGPVPRARLRGLWKEVLAAGHAQAWQLRENPAATSPSGRSPSSHPS